MGFLDKALHGVVWLVSGEWFLIWPRRRANGGGVIAARALITTVVLYAGAVAVYSMVRPGVTWAFSFAALVEATRNTLEWFPATFAATYAAYYARFSSQWAYLADLYNQIKAKEVDLSAEGQDLPEAFHEWRAGFIEDADDLHLALKRMFAPVIAEWAKDEGVRHAFKTYTHNGTARLDKLLLEIERRATDRHSRLPPLRH